MTAAGEAEAVAEAVGDAVAETFAAGFFAAVAVPPPLTSAVVTPATRPSTQSTASADARSLPIPALPLEPCRPLLLEAVSGTPAFALFAPRQGFRPPLSR